MSCSLIAGRPCQAACARAVLRITISARWPSTLNEVVSWAMVNRSRCVCVTCGSARARLGDLRRKLLLVRQPLLVEALGVLLVGHAALDDGHPLPRVGDAVHVDAQREAVEQLRAQVAFLGVHGADQDEARPGG